VAKRRRSKPGVLKTPAAYRELFDGVTEGLAEELGLSGSEAVDGLRRTLLGAFGPHLRVSGVTEEDSERSRRQACLDRYRGLQAMAAEVFRVVVHKGDTQLGSSLATIMRVQKALVDAEAQMLGVRALKDEADTGKRLGEAFAQARGMSGSIERAHGVEDDETSSGEGV
jgi:hypothetical protein